jgi:hypothetical protein
VTSLACGMGRVGSYNNRNFLFTFFIGAPTDFGTIPEHDCTPPAGSSVVKFTKPLEKVKQKGGGKNDK